MHRNLHICTPDKIPLGVLIRPMCPTQCLCLRFSPANEHTYTHTRLRRAKAHHSINNIACRQFLFSSSHAMTSQGLTYSQCYRAARVKSD